MSEIIAKRKRAKKACIPCHHRKRRCDGTFPCGMCVSHEYNCKYAEGENASTAGSAGQVPLAIKRSRPNGDSVTTSQASGNSQSEQTSLEAAVSLEQPTSTATVPTTASIFDEQKFKYAGSTAAMAFPHILSVALGSDSGPKVKFFAYNFGVRPEEPSHAHGLLSDLISETDLANYSDTYFSAIGPIGEVLDPRIYAQRCRDYYQGLGNNTTAFGAIAAGVAALGSFFSSRRCPREADLMQYAKAILDDPASLHTLNVDHIVAWTVRFLYLRATSRPNNAWVASCTTMHLCDAVGLHDEEQINRIASSAGAAALGHDADRLRRIFWISWAGHNILSYEYDRSPVTFRFVTCQPIIPTAGSVIDQFVRIAQIIPTPNSPFRLYDQPPTVREEVFERLKSLDKLQVTHPFLVVTRADVACCFYRRIYQLKMGISDEISYIMIQIGIAAVEAAQQSASQGHLHWNIIGSVFQFACVLLAMDTPTASAHIPAVLKCLESLVSAVDTRMTREALSMVQHLLNLNLAKKRHELTQLEFLQPSSEALQAEPQPDEIATTADFTWELDWDQFLLEPYIPIPSQDV